LKIIAINPNNKITKIYIKIAEFENIYYKHQALYFRNIDHFEILKLLIAC